jgi:hypothetical protein
MGVGPHGAPAGKFLGIVGILALWADYGIGIPKQPLHEFAKAIHGKTFQP